MSGFIKICGVTSVAEAHKVVASGADALGINLWPKSPRYVTVETAQTIIQAVKSQIETVLVTVDTPLDDLKILQQRLQPSAIQLHGNEPDAWVTHLGTSAYKAIGLATEEDVARALSVGGSRVLVDAKDEVLRGGTGRLVPRELAKRVCLARTTILAGGLSADNVALAIEQCHPWGVDAVSKLESTPGVKDESLLNAFVQAAREAFQKLGHTDV